MNIPAKRVEQFNQQQKVNYQRKEVAQPARTAKATNSGNSKRENAK
jgi:hypothetical protein